MRSAVLLASACGIVAGPLSAQQVDTVRVGSPSLRDARLMVGSYAIRSFVRADGVETPMSSTTQRVRRGRRGGDDVYVIQTLHAATGDTTRSSIIVRTTDFSLVHHRVKAARDSAAVTATAGFLTGWVVLPDEPIRLLDRELERAVFPVEGQVPWLFPLLPLAEGYAAAIPHFSEWQGGEEWSTIRVLGSETVQVGALSVDCWKVDGGELFPGYRVTHWVDKETRRLVQGVARGAATGPEYWARVQTP